MAGPSSDYHRGEMDIAEQTKTFHLIMGMTKWGSLVLAAFLLAVVLATSTQGLAHQQVLVNLGQEVAAGFEGFERVIEVVGLEEAQRQAARARWRHYTDLGYAITRHDLVPKTLDQNPA